MAKEPTKEAATEKPKRGKVSSKWYIDPEGEKHRSAVANWVEHRIEFSDGHKLSIFRKDLSEDMLACAAAHGISQKRGDAYADSKGDVAVAHEDCLAMDEQILAGNWITTSKSTGPRIGLLVEAVVAAMTKAGKEFDEAGIAERMKDKEHAKRARANPQVDVEYKRLESERQAARLKAAQEKAKGADSAGLDDL